ncbi:MULTISPECIES: trypsin-like peptidase domain-containing protein [Streptomyces]|uniref:vWA-MoxR associated protein C-terminal domain-containing protein n=1 Tax=Streptomyces plumbiresistens TaxID=511811 RepID=A0ABP7T739_9ACTN
MGWFGTAGDGAGGGFPHIVSVRDGDGGVVGAGFVLSGDTVLTCAHVVNAALGRAMFASEAPGPAEITVDMHRHTYVTQRHRARVTHWIAPHTRGGGAVRPDDDEWLGDVAVLQLPQAGAPLGAPRFTAMAVGQEVEAWHGSGREATYAFLTVGRLNESRAFLDGSPTGMAVGFGYSGSPVWSKTEKAVVGMIVGHFMPPPGPHSTQHNARRSWAAPWQRIESELRLRGVLNSARPDLTDLPDPDDPAFLLLVEAIEDIYRQPSSRVDSARRLSRDCGVLPGSDVTPPTPEEFAAFLLTHPRALAALAGSLRRNAPADADRVLAAGGLSRTPRLLSPREHAALGKLLGAMEPAVLARFPEAVRAALPHLAARPGGDTLEALFDHLESLSGDGRAAGSEPRVPALLRVMEYIAVLCGNRKAELRLWTDAVASRLGIAPAAIRERRSDAREWERSLRARAARVRVLVQVKQADRGRHRLRIWCDEGAGPRQVSTDSVRSYSASEAAREVLRTLDSLTPPAEDERPPLVEVLVDRGGLNLPVDEWTARDPEAFLPGVLGVEFPLVVHCPDILRRHGRFLPHWRSRWSRLDSGKTFVVSESMDRDTIYSKLVNQLDTVRVCVDVPPGPRDGIVQTCLALGIPVVVWDRGRDGTSHTVRYTAQIATPELPDGVRDYRANAKASPPDFPGRPVLAWADADRTVPRLHLTEPQESA